MNPLGGSTPQKNIVLLSDGTGNSAAKLMKTNVWRMYEAVDLMTGDQIACYDNGVGTSSFKPLAVIGGAVGWGLKRNVRHLYTYACSHYVPASDGRPADRLYGFGFSRGAFTMRVLMGLIESQGLIAGARGGELDRLAKWAYREYRRKFNVTRGLVTPLRFVRDVLLRAWERVLGRRPYSETTRVTPEIAFLGLWDTVDAYGLPIDEMTRGWDQWVWPLSMCERTAPANISKVCHALALDDERHTFHPVLLDERADRSSGRQTAPIDHTDRERVTQVWFAGVHSDVGGGSPDDSLAHVPLLWMGIEAAKQGLRLHPNVMELWKARADPNGPASDSRRGLAAYYRYNPRSIKRLTDDRFADVRIERPKIHESVFRRIVGARDGYAPIVLPERYDVVRRDGVLLNDGNNPYEDSTQSQSRCADQERIWNKVWLRRVLYFSTVAVTLVIVLSPYLLKEPVLSSLDLPSGTLSGALSLLGAFLPEMLRPIAVYWEGHPVIFGVLALALAALFSLSTIVQRSIGDAMRDLWDDIVRHGPRNVDPSAEPQDFVYRLRTHPLYRGAFQFTTQRLFPLIFGLASLAALVLMVVGTVNRAAFAVASAAGFTCPEPVRMQQTGPGEWDGIEFNNQHMCQPTGVDLERGHTYTVLITLPRDWADASHPAGLAGFGSSENPFVYIPAVPFRRVLRERWFVPIARIGRRSPELHALTKPVTEITPRRGGPLYLFVNDAVGIPPWRDYFYANNKGSPATVKVVDRTSIVAPRGL